MGGIASFLANKLVAPFALAGCLVLAVVAGVQTIRVNGISFFGWYVVQGYKPQLEALQSQNLSVKLAQANATIKELSDINAVLSNSNNSNHADALHWRDVASDLQKKAPIYVTKEIATACVPLGLAELLDASGTGGTLPEVDESARQSLSTCSGVSVSDATETLMRDLGLIPILTARIENARQAWLDQAAIINGEPHG